MSTIIFLSHLQFGALFMMLDEPFGTVLLIEFAPVVGAHLERVAPVAPVTHVSGAHPNARNAALARSLARLSGHPPPPKPKEKKSRGMMPNRTLARRKAVYTALVNHFNREEVAELIFLLNLNADDIMRPTLRATVISIVQCCERRDRLVELKKLIARMRPGAFKRARKPTEMRPASCSASPA